LPLNDLQGWRVHLGDPILGRRLAWLSARLRRRLCLAQGVYSLDLHTHSPALAASQSQEVSQGRRHISGDSPRAPAQQCSPPWQPSAY
jgi:hypothetical protein